jgi:hypothetical protein
MRKTAITDCPDRGSKGLQDLFVHNAWFDSIYLNLADGGFLLNPTLSDSVECVDKEKFDQGLFHSLPGMWEKPTS